MPSSRLAIAVAHCFCFICCTCHLFLSFGCCCCSAGGAWILAPARPRGVAAQRPQRDARSKLSLVSCTAHQTVQRSRFGCDWLVQSVGMLLGTHLCFRSVVFPLFLFVVLVTTPAMTWRTTWPVDSSSSSSRVEAAHSKHSSLQSTLSIVAADTGSSRLRCTHCSSASPLLTRDTFLS